jgi:hypothetical protein
MGMEGGIGFLSQTSRDGGCARLCKIVRCVPVLPRIPLRNFPAFTMARIHARWMASMIDSLVVGRLYSNEEIFRSLKVANAAGSAFRWGAKAVLRAVIMTSVQGLHGVGENPYHDRLEAGILTYTAAGKVGQQTLASVNIRLIEQATFNFPIHGFVLIASRRDASVGRNAGSTWGFSNPDTQLDADGKARKVWLLTSGNFAANTYRIETPGPQ